MIRFQTSQLGDEDLHLAGEEDGALLDLEGDPVAREDGPIAYDLSLERAGGELIVRGEIRAPMKLRCRRCAELFSTIVRVSSFLHAYDWEECPEFLDVSEDVREDILLEVPGYPLCAEACQGLCPQCGQNLNGGACGCRPVEDALSPWAALNEIVVADAPESRSTGRGGPRGKNKE